MPPFETTTGVRNLLDRYDAFILDQWGVLHDGTQPYGAALDCLQRLHALGKGIAVLTNSGKRAATNRRVLLRMGFPLGFFDVLVSSGEVAWSHLKERTDPWFAGLGRTCVYFSRGQEDFFLEGLDLDVVDRAEEAEFVLACGTDSPEKSLADYEPVLTAAAERYLPMLCANPDLVAPRGDGVVFSPGTLARRYEDMGGSVRYLGKPHPEVYDVCLKELEITDRSRVVAIGDSLKHDIAGALSAGLDCAFIAGGIHSEALGIRPGETPRDERLPALFDETGFHPTWSLPLFQW